MKYLRFIASVLIFYCFHFVLAFFITWYSSAPFIFGSGRMWVIDKIALYLLIYCLPYVLSYFALCKLTKRQCFAWPLLLVYLANSSYLFFSDKFLARGMEVDSRAFYFCLLYIPPLIVLGVLAIRKMTPRLSRILFSPAGAALAVPLLIAGYFAVVPSEGQYWGIDRNKSPESAAEEAFAEGDFRFLGSRIGNSDADETEWVYAVFECVCHPLGDGWAGHSAHFAELKGRNAWSIAGSIKDFGETYNLRLLALLEENNDVRCSRNPDG